MKQNLFFSQWEKYFLHWTNGKKTVRKNEEAAEQNDAADDGVVVYAVAVMAVQQNKCQKKIDKTKRNTKYKKYIFARRRTTKQK